MATTESRRDTSAREAWLNQISEPVLEPDLPIIDPHHHLWDHPTSRYLLDEILADTGSGHKVLATVFVEWPRCIAPTVPRRCVRWARPSSSTASRR